MTKPEAKERLWKLYWLTKLEKNGQATEEQHDELDEILREVMSLDIRSTSVLLLRYRWRATFSYLAEELHYSTKQIRRIHDKALEKYIESLEK